jgi:hypothetical protein
MRLPTRDMLFGMTLGAVCATALAATGPGFVVDVIADEMPAGFDTSRLVRFDDRLYEVDHEPWVSTDPISTTTVKKIEAGRVSRVAVTTTATGTYSSEALFSPHVSYPGIEVDEVHRYGYPYFWFSDWHNGRWVRISSYNGNSYVTVHNNGVRVRTSPNGTCVMTQSFWSC